MASGAVPGFSFWGVATETLAAAPPGAGEGTARGDGERREASITDSASATDWIDGEGRREGVGCSVTRPLPFVCLEAGSESVGGWMVTEMFEVIAFWAPD